METNNKATKTFGEKVKLARKSAGSPIFIAQKVKVRTTSFTIKNLHLKSQIMFLLHKKVQMHKK